MKKDKMYWKEGFYDEPIEGSVEITKEYWLQLLNEQSNGKKIVSNEKGYPITITPIETLEEFKERVIREIKKFDKSEAINSFSLRGNNMWFDKDLRSSIMETVKIKLSKSITKSSIWFNNTEYILNCEDIISMLEDVSIYADSCNSTTERHIANITNMNTNSEIENYNYRLNYPIKLMFNF